MYRDDMMYGAMSPAEQRASEVLKRIQGTEDPVGVEVGVFTGRMSRALLDHDALMLYMVDSWEGDGAAYASADDDWHARLPQAAQDSFMAEADMRTSFADLRRCILRCRSKDAANSFEDGVLDFVFIDADHSYEGCASDIAAWFAKVKPGGWICGHDYQNTQMPFDGVTRAVDEFIAETGLTLETGINFTWFARVPEQRNTERNVA